jgi:hypothetical protein
MHKFRIISMALLVSLILGSGLAAFTNSNYASAQNNAGINPGNGTSPTTLQVQPSSMQALQENSLTTNVQPQAGISSLTTEHQDPNLNALLTHPNVKALLQNPNLNSLLENPDPNAMLEDPNVKALLESPEVNALLEESSVKTQIENQ